MKDEILTEKEKQKLKELNNWYKAKIEFLLSEITKNEIKIENNIKY